MSKILSEYEKAATLAALRDIAERCAPVSGEWHDDDVVHAIWHPVNQALKIAEREWAQKGDIRNAQGRKP